jgi:hypothetical protein
MATKRLTIELSVDQYELLHREAKEKGTSVTGFIRRMIDEIRLRPKEEVRRNYKTDPLYKRSGSFEGPADLAKNHDRYLY